MFPVEVEELPHIRHMFPEAFRKVLLCDASGWMHAELGTLKRQEPRLACLGVFRDASYH